MPELPGIAAYEGQGAGGSPLVESDWPRTLDEWEALKKREMATA
jgi:hypothetical protein